MNIIFVSDGMARTRSISLRSAMLLVGLLVLLPVVLILAFIVPHGSHEHQEVKKQLPTILNVVSANELTHIDALAQQLGEVEARITRLDALSARLATMAGVKESAADALPPGRGGPAVHAHHMSEQELKDKLNELAQSIDLRSDKFSMLEAVMLQKRLQASTLPSTMPTDVAYNSSSYGWRVDPFSGQMAFHEGLDFVAGTGTPVYASAEGIVTTAERTHDYGKIVKIDHGAGLETRYAHASELLVKPGEHVERGQLIARVGSTGRSTGAHLHFEVRLNGAALDPRKYLQSMK
ncbi:Peptidase family M23 [Methylobacillus rhizosphaerae]|uniref:Peptidase family M23 n=1 Tax=Methylobacillus rhizosphaerae TaxID=551994 RepID=A0A238Y119_9PROT|nr:M23 family metallopeptidase [Methylobacillus rhizosphaerae]SNR64461.1 Peptidase family M23 [Methylobacillus rhizosphaerae]